MNKKIEEDFKILNTVTEYIEIPKVIEPLSEEEINKAFDKLIEHEEIKTTKDNNIKKSFSNFKTY